MQFYRWFNQQRQKLCKYAMSANEKKIRPLWQTIVSTTLIKMAIQIMVFLKTADLWVTSNSSQLQDDESSGRRQDNGILSYLIYYSLYILMRVGNYSLLKSRTIVFFILNCWKLIFYGHSFWPNYRRNL